MIRSGVFVGLSLTALLAASPGSAQQMPGPRMFRIIPNIESTSPGQQCGSPARVENGELLATLVVDYKDYTIFNPMTGLSDRVHLRSYNGCPYGPTIRLKPTETIRLTVKNNLPSSEPTFTCTDPVSPVGTTPPPENHTVPDCFNTTNVHFHGLHVSPSGNSDNVFLQIRPGAQLEYEVNLPADHPAGTFWYHSHRHGSTALDVSSGMEGVIVVTGTRRVQDKNKNGGVADIDTILHSQGDHPLKEHIFLFQQIEYGCFDSPTDTDPLPHPNPPTAVHPPWTCDGSAGQKGEIRGYINQLAFPGGVSTWELSGRFTQINGEVQPQFPPQGETLRAGEIQRWRLVHGGIRDTIGLKIVKANALASSATNAPASSAVSQRDISIFRQRLSRARTSEDRRLVLNGTCNGETVRQEEFARDGLTQTMFHDLEENILQPAYRSDILVAFPTPGVYCLIDEEADVTATVAGGETPTPPKSTKDRRLLGLVQVSPGINFSTGSAGQLPSGYWSHVRDRLLAANPDLPAAVRNDLQAMKVSAYAPVPQVPGPAIANKGVSFFIGPPPAADPNQPPPPKPQPNPPPTPVEFAVNASSTNGTPTLSNTSTYDPTWIDYAATVGETDQWTLSNNGASHIFHIHVNPFQIIDIRNPQGQSIIDANGHCTEMDLKGPTNKPIPDPQYCDQIGTVRDTIFLKGRPNGAPATVSGYTVVMRTRYDRYVGEFVLHCHILDHEDRGMMANVLIVPSKDDLPVGTAALASPQAPTGLAMSNMHH